MDNNSVNKVIIVGRLGKDPDVRYTPSGDAVADLAVATSERFKNKEGDFQEKTEWHNCVVWRRTAEFAKNYLTKGLLVYIEGRIRTEKWQNKDGENRYSTKIQVSNLVPLEWKDKKNSGGNYNQGPSKQQVSENKKSEEDEIPF